MNQQQAITAELLAEYVAICDEKRKAAARVRELEKRIKAINGLLGGLANSFECVETEKGLTWSGIAYGYAVKIVQSEKPGYTVAPTTQTRYAVSEVA